MDWSFDGQTLVFADNIPFDVIDVEIGDDPFAEVTGATVWFDTSLWFWTR